MSRTFSISRPRGVVPAWLLAVALLACGDGDDASDVADAAVDPGADDAGDDAALDTSSPRARDAGPPRTDVSMDDCEFGSLAPGVCRPEPPRGTPASACPSGERAETNAFDRGLCAPASPQSTPIDDCPSGVWTAWDDVGGGVCAPLRPVLAAWDGPPGWEMISAWDIDPDKPPSDELPAWSAARPIVDNTCEQRPTLDGACIAPGAPCPDQTFPSNERIRERADSADGALFFVAVDAADGGDGSRERPWSDLDMALRDVPDGSVVTFDGDVASTGLTVGRNVALVGSCYERARLTFVGADGVRVDTTARIADVAISGSDDAVAVDILAGEVVLEGVHIDGADVAIRVAEGASLEGVDVLVTDVRDGVVASGAQVQLTDTAIRDVRGVGMSSVDATLFTLADVVVDQGGDETRPDTRGIALEGGSAALQRVAVRGSMRGIDASNVTSLSVTDAWLAGLGGLVGDTSALGFVARDCDVSLERVVTEGWFGSAIDVEGGELTAHMLAALPGRNRSDSITPRPSASIRIGAGTAFAASQLTVNGAWGSAVHIDGASGSLTDAVVFDSRFAGRAHAAMTRTGRAVVIMGGADVDLERIYVERGYAQLIDLRASDVRVRDVAVRDGIQIRAGEDIAVFEDDATALRAWDGATVIIERFDADRVTPVGVAAESGSDVLLRDAVLRGTEYEGTPLGPGVGTSSGTLDDFMQGEPPTLRVERSLIEGYQTGASLSDGNPSLTDVVIRGGDVFVNDEIEHTTFAGVFVGGEATLTRVRIEDREEAGVLVAGGRLFADDLDIRRTDRTPSGQGLSLSGGVARVVRGRVSGSALHGVVTTSRSSLTATDLIVEGNQGRGIAIQRDTIANIERALVTSNDGIGVYVADNGRATLTDVVVTRTQLLACAATTCADAGEGFGVAVFDASTLELLRVLIDGNATIGLAVDRQGEVTASQGVVSHQLIGVNITAPGFDPSTAFDNVRSIANQVDLSARDLPVPSLVDDIATGNDEP